MEKIVASGVATLELVIKVAPQKNDGSLLYKLYNRIDRRLFRADALEPVSVEDLFHEKNTNKETELDVVVNFASSDLNPQFADRAKYGVWFYDFGDAPGVNELIHKIPVSVAALKAFKGDQEHVVYQSVSPTLSRFSVRLNNNTIFWKSAAFVARALEDLYHQRELDQSGVSHASAFNPNPTPGNAAMTSMFLKLSGRAAARAFEKLSSFEQWILAYKINRGDWQYLIPPPDRFWADPFPIEANDKHYIFFEDYVNAAGRAHIAVVEVDQNGIVSGPTEVLKLDCHLSYPFVFEHEGDYFMIPEMGGRNVVELYRAVSFPFEWRPEKVLLEAKSPLDATVINVEGTWWMFVNIEEPGVAVNWDELHLYYAASLFGPWRPHARNPIVSDVRSARPAGRLFWSNNELYRPSQDSSLRYGYATTINKVTELSAVAYNETEVLKILPDWDKDIIGVHTLNWDGDLLVLDCLWKRKRLQSSRPRPPKDSLDLVTSANMEARGKTGLDL
ncbi:MAG TPA: hypothetical protein VLB87_14235 [Pyrinomonadaceae bacterium]|nr:hypothetical protein [Pyrinomonadaceae bacterium]